MVFLLQMYRIWLRDQSKCAKIGRLQTTQPPYLSGLSHHGSVGKWERGDRYQRLFILFDEMLNARLWFVLEVTTLPSKQTHSTKGAWFCPHIIVGYWSFEHSICQGELFTKRFLHRCVSLRSTLRSESRSRSTVAGLRGCCRALTARLLSPHEETETPTDITDKRAKLAKQTKRAKGAKRANPLIGTVLATMSGTHQPIQLNHCQFSWYLCVLRSKS